MEPITTAALAAALFIAQKSGEKIGEEAGSATWSAVGRLVATIRERLSGDTEARPVLARAEEDPDDGQAAAALGGVLQHRMESDEVFAQRLEVLVAQARDEGKVDRRVVVQADTIKALFQDQVTVQGDFNIS